MSYKIQIDSFMNEKQKETYNKFEIYVLNELSVNNQNSYKSAIKRFIQTLGNKTFEEAQLKDFEKFIISLTQSKEKSRKKGCIKSRRTIKAYIVRIKRFYKWIYEQINAKIGEKNKEIEKENENREKPLPLLPLKEFPLYFKSDLFKVKNVSKSAVRKEQILTEDEIFRMVKACKNFRDQCLIALTYETFSRIGEVLALKIKNIKERKDKYRYIEKTIFKLGTKGTDEEVEKREIPIGISTYYLDNWLRNHPDSKNPEAWLFQGRKGGHLTERQALYIIKEAGEKANLEKEVKTHLIRHSAITNKRSLLGLSDKQTRYIAGWSEYSNMLAVYDKFTETGQDELAGQLLGKEIIDKKEPQKAIVCSRCQAENHPTEEYCVRCHLNLKLSFSDKEMEKEEKYEKTIEELKQTNDILKNNQNQLIELVLKSINAKDTDKSTEKLSEVIKGLKELSLK